MTAKTDIAPDLRSAETLEEMLEAVPRLAECDTLEAAGLLADYDRKSKGWIRVGLSWLFSASLITWLMLFLAGLLFFLSGLVAVQLAPAIEPWVGAISEMLLRVLLGFVSAAILIFIFDRLGPKRWLISATHKLRQRIQLRLLLLKAIRSHIKRNSRKVDGDWRRAVCQKCLARFETYFVRFAYWRFVSFARCRKCRDDRDCYTRVKTIAGWLDRGMSTSQEQVGAEVKVNMRDRLPPRSLSLPLDLDELVIANVEDDDVEVLIFFYRSKQSKTDLPKANRLRCRLARNSTASLMSRRQLKESFALMAG